MIPYALRRAWRLALDALALAAGLACIWPAALRAQLPAPPASARSPIHLGGYGSLVLGLDELGAPQSAGTPAPGTVTGSAVALLVSGTPLARLSYFAELDGAARSRENWPGREDNRGWDVARLYGELSLGDALRLRAGRFLTPVGQWNEVHADPLTWTSQRPLTTYRAFAKSVTGLMAAGARPLGGRDAGYAIYWAPVASPGIAGDETSFLNAAGGRVALEVLPNLYLGASAAAYRASRPRAADEDSAEAEAADGNGSGSAEGAWSAGAGGGTLARADALGTGEIDGPDRESDGSPRRLLGADLSWTTGRLELLAEATALSAQGTRRAERGGFVQAALPLIGPVFMVLRTEAYTPVVRGALRIHTLGLTARPSPHVTLKLERQFTSRPSTRAGDGWFASASAIF
ncbi:MAG TPA: hypothetical protein VF832_06060 [Longimicrobiales bacterium]